MVTITGNLGILTQRDIDRRVVETSQGALPASITKQRRRQLERGLREGRLEQSNLRTKDQKIKANDLSPSVYDIIFAKLGFKKLPTSIVSGVGPLSALKEAKKLQNAETLQKTMFGKVIAKGKTGGFISSILGFTQRGAFGDAIFSTLLNRVIPAAVLIKIGTALWKMYKAQYGKGGTRDVRKLILSEDVSRIGIDNENELESAANLFLSNPQLLTGLPRGPSNTENLREGMARYKQRHEGTYGR